MTPARFGLLVLGALLVAGVAVYLANRWAPAADTRAVRPLEQVPLAGDQRVRVEVLNAAGTAGLARSATERLRDAGFDVVYYGNASAFGRDSSLVVDRVGDPGHARAVAEALGIRRVETRPDTSLYLEVTVLLGEDWQ